MIIRKFIHKNPRADCMLMFDPSDCANKCLCWPWRFSVMGSNELLTPLSRTLAVCYTVDQWPLSSIQIYTHPTACCFWFLQFPVLRMIVKCASWVIRLVAALAASQWTNWCLRSCWLPLSEVFDVAPANWLDFNPHPPGSVGFVSMVCWCGFGEEDDNENMWEVLRTI